MDSIFKLFKQKIIWLGLAGVFVIITLLSLGILGSSINPNPRNMKVALVVLDKGAAGPNGQRINFGKTIAANITEAQPGVKASPLKWTILGSEKEAMDGLDNETYYGALIIPEDMSLKIATIQGKMPISATAKMYINQGMNSTAATIVTQVLDKMSDGINSNIRTQILQIIKLRGNSLTTEQAKALSNPINFTAVPVNEVPSHSGNGNAPISLAQLSWMTGIASSLFIFFGRKKLLSSQNANYILSVVAQTIAGAIYAIIASLGALLWIRGVLDMYITNYGKFCLYFGITCFCFFLIQSCVLNWLGTPWAILFILVFFFGTPLLTLPPESLPTLTRHWLYPWIPMRFGAEIFRDILYFGKGINSDTPLKILGITGGISFILSILSYLKPQKSEITA